MGRWMVVGALLLLVGCDGGDGGADAGADGSASCVSAGDCDDGLYCNGAERCDATDPAADARGCVAGSDPCVGAEVCDEAEMRCAVEGCETPDADDDGHRSIACGGADCDDDDASRYPGNAEVCDVGDVDEDCDPRTFGYRDQDMDGNPDASCCNGELCGRDCDDTDPTIGMDAELCDGRDNDCNGVIDDVSGGGSCSCTVLGETRDCGPDRSLDGVGICRTGTETCAAGVWVCDGAVGAGVETCNGLDDDCDGSADEDFECAQGAETDCGPVTDDESWPGDARTCASMGSTSCSALCEAGACQTDAEDCDYCDDDGDGVEDEIPMASGESSAPLWSSGTCEALGRSSCSTEALIGADGRGTYGGLFRSEAFTVGYGAVTIGGKIALMAGGLCEGTYALVVYREPGSLSLGTHAGGVDRSQTGVAVEHTITTLTPVPLANVRMRELPVTASSEVASTTPEDGVPCYSAGDSIFFRLRIEPHAPSGPSGVTRYTLTDYVADELSFEGAPIYPGDQIRVGVVAQAEGDTTAYLDALSVTITGACP